MSGSASDGGTGSRLRGSLLTWLSEKTSDVFVVATANSILGLPPEMTRRGRFSEIIFVSIPTEEERRAIWKIHLSLCGQLDHTKKHVNSLSEMSEGFSGAEIEQAVIDALYESFAPGKEVVLTKQALEAAIKSTVPLSRSRSADLAAFKEWAESNARPASSMPEVEKIIRSRPPALL